MKKSDEYERIPLSSLKQFIYCKRRFALMYINCDWGSNYKIVEGDILHSKVDDPFFNEKRREIYTSRSVPVYSNMLNIHGVADIVEFIIDEDGVKLPRKKGAWKINPVEYKNGKPEKSNADNYQLCAQAMCLEEMFGVKISKGDIYYGKIKRRVEVSFSQELKCEVENKIKEMISLLIQEKIPLKDENQNCSLCSLYDRCIPKPSVKIKKNLKHDLFKLIY